LLKPVPNPADGFAATRDAKFPFFGVRDFYVGIPMHRRPVFLVFNRVRLTKDATFTVAVLVSPLDDMGSWPIAPTLAFPLCTLLG
jgi:hypothetical protein